MATRRDVQMCLTFVRDTFVRSHFTYRFDYSNGCKNATAKCEDNANDVEACFDAEYYCEKSAERLEAGAYCIAIAMLFLATLTIGISTLVIYSRFSKSGCCRPVPESDPVAGL